MTLPSDFISLAREVVGQEIDQFIDAITADEPVTSLRYNSAKPTEVTGRPVPWCPTGRYLDVRPRFTDDPLLHAGAYYVQEASSMFLWQMLSRFVPRDAVVLDACAAPGGKSTLVAEYLAGQGMLVSNEFIARRANILVENITKWGQPNVAVTNSPVTAFERTNGLFDCVVVDAPCSGEGMFRKDENSVAEWSMDNVRMCAARQREILSSAWRALRPGGVLIYSTCTYNRIEDEENTAWICRELEGERLTTEIPAEWGITETEPGCYHFFPHRVRGEGLFMSAFRKPDDAYAAAMTASLKPASLKPAKEQPDMLLHPDDYIITELRGARWAVARVCSPVVGALLAAGVNVIMPGIQYAEMRGRDWMPAPGLALSSELNQAAVNAVEVDLPTALAYLRTEAIRPDVCERGIVLISYQGHPLGWAKCVGNRCNNLYPTYWRVRHY